MTRPRMGLGHGTRGDLILAVALRAGPPTRSVHELVELPYAQGLTRRVHTGNPSVVSSSRRGTSSYRRTALMLATCLVLLLVTARAVVKRMRRT
jgi:hypothetical protein